MNDKKQKNEAKVHCGDNLSDTDADVVNGNMAESFERNKSGDKNACGNETCNDTGNNTGNGAENGTVNKAGSGAGNETDNAANEASKANEANEANEASKANEAAEIKALKEELEAVKAELQEQTKKCGEYLDRLQRTAAEFDNFKKRTAKEKEALYDDAVCDVIREFLPVIDNLERAQNVVSAESSAQSLKDGVELVLKQFRETLKKIGVEEIKALNETFDPMLHNAVMHVEDESLGHSVVVEEFQKGYIFRDRVIRYSMVKVAN
jgi:molecular chaperone GrpE